MFTLLYFTFFKKAKLIALLLPTKTEFIWRRFHKTSQLHRACGTTDAKPVGVPKLLCGRAGARPPTHTHTGRA